jgi:hypothetical protein
MSTNDAVFQRRNKQIEDAIDGQNLKQALQLIEKRIKKGEDTPFLKVRLRLRMEAVLPSYFYCFFKRRLLFFT